MREQIELIWLHNPLSYVFVDHFSFHTRSYDSSKFIWKCKVCIYLINQKGSLDYICFTRWNSVISLEWQPMQHSPSRYYYKDVSIVLQEKWFGFISEDLKPDIAFVCEVMSKVCEYVMGNYMHNTIVNYFSDRCAARCKNYKYFLNLCDHYSDFDLEAEWNFLCNQSCKICC